LNLGMIAPLPAYVVQLQTYDPGPAPSGILDRCLWYAVGDAFRPRGLFGLTPRWDTGYARWVLEIVELRADNFFVVRTLMRQAVALCRGNEYLLTGEVDARNVRLRRFLSSFFSCEPDRVRFTGKF
jgi:hypothetical protein